MAKVQKNPSPCNEKISCNCNSFNELQKIREVIAKIEKQTIGTLPTNTGYPLLDKIIGLYLLIEKKKEDYEFLSMVLKDEIETKKYWRELYAFEKGREPLESTNFTYTNGVKEVKLPKIILNNSFEM